MLSIEGASSILRNSSRMDIGGFIKEEEQFRKKEAPPEIRISRGA